MRGKEISWYKKLLGLKKTEPSNNKVFLDSNILIYSILESDLNNSKRNKTINLLDDLQNSNEIIISTQVLGEVFNVLSKRYKIDKNEIINRLKIISQNTAVKSITESTIKKSWDIAVKNNYSYYDCLILASALENDCSVIYTEDLDDCRNIEKKLKIVNPYN